MKTIKKIMMGLAAVVGFTTAALAATPTVVWDGDFGTASKVGTDGLTYTLDLQGNTVTDGVLNITDANVGAKITPSSDSQGKVSVLIKYSKLVAISGKKPVIATAEGNYTTDIGLAGHTAGGLGLNGFYDNNDTRYGIGDSSGSTETGTLATPVTGSGYFLFTHDRSSSGGTAGYAGATIAGLTGNKSTKLRWDNTNLRSVCIGGPRVTHSKYPAWTGLKIQAVAIFYGSQLTPSDIASYRFPSERFVQNARWGNIGDATNGGSATSVNRMNEQSAGFSISFADATNIGTCQIGATGTLLLKKVRIVSRNDSYYPSTVTVIPDGGSEVETSTYTAGSNDGFVYKPDGSKIEATTTRKYMDFTFATPVELDTSKTFTLKVNNGMTCVQPSNTTMNYGSSGTGFDAYSPAVELVGDYYDGPKPSEMYYNRSAGSETVPADTYGAITVEGKGLKATAYTTRTTLSNTASAPEIGGSYVNIIQKPSKDTDTATHTFAGWFKIGSLPASGSTTFLYQARSRATSENDNGYMVAVTDAGEIKVGKTHKEAFADGLVSTGASITGGKWFHLAVSVTKTSGARTATPDVYVNGNKVAMAIGTFATNLGGNNCSGVDIGPGVSAAGIYVDNGALVCPVYIQSLATNSKYVSYVPTTYTLDMTQNESVSTAGWDPEKTGAFLSVDTLDVTNKADTAVTLTFDENTAVKKILATSEANKELTLAKGDNVTVSATDGFDFSAAQGKTTVNFATGSTTIKPGGNTVLTQAPTVGIEVGTGKKLTLGWSAIDTAYNQVISGAGAVDITGQVQLSANNTLSGTMTIKSGGTLKMGGTQCLNASNAATVDAGGVLDVNAKNSTVDIDITLNGGTLRNNGSSVDDGKRMMKKITLTANSTIELGKDFGLIANGYGDSTLALGSYTLTKTGSGNFWLVSTAISGTGKLLVEGGTVNLTNKGSKNCTCADGTFEIGANGTLKIDSKTLTLKGLTVNGGTINNTGTLTGLAVLNGTVNFNNIGGTIGFANAVTVASGTTTLSTAAVTALSGKTVSVGADGILDIRTTRSGVPLASIAEGGKLSVKQLDGETQTITISGTSLADGDDYASKMQVCEKDDDTTHLPVKTAVVSGGTLTITLDNTIFAVDVTEAKTISQIEEMALGEGKTFEQSAQLTIRASNSPVITVDKSLHITKFAITGQATLKFNSGCIITAPTISATELVTIDCSTIAAGEGNILIGTISDTSKFTTTGVSGSQSVEITETGVKVYIKDTLTRNNPVTGETGARTFTHAFLGSEDGDWSKPANWRSKNDDNVLKAYSGNNYPQKPSGNHDWDPALIDGNLIANDASKTVTLTTCEGWNARIGVLNGAHVTIGTLNKFAGGSSYESWYWVDATSTLTIGSVGSGTCDHDIDFCVANENGLTFTTSHNKTRTFNYYLTGNGTVNYAQGVAAGTHKIKQLEVKVGTVEKAARTIAKQKLINLGAASAATFSAANDIQATCDNVGVTPTYSATKPTVNQNVGTYSIAQESDGVYAYVVAYSDKWDIVEPLTGTLTADTAWSSIVWKDFYDHEGADLTLPHTYKVVGTTFTATQGGSVVEGSSIEVVSGTLELASGATIGTETYTIDNGATLLVKVSGLKASKVTNNGGTLKFEGGSAASPIAVTGDGNLPATIAADTHVKFDDGGTARQYNITGSGATSFYTVARNGTGNPGMANPGETRPNRFNNVIICSLSTGGDLWIEHGALDADGTVGLNVTGNIKLSDLDTPIVLRSVNGDKSLSGQAFTIKCKENANFAGTSAQAITIDVGDADAVQTFSGNYTGALTVNASAQVKLTGTAQPSSIVANGTVTIDPNGTAKTITGAITGSGSIIVNDSSAGATGGVKFSNISGFTGTITYVNGTFDLGTARTVPSGYTFEAGVKFTATQTQAEYAQGIASSFTGFTQGQTITLTKLVGEPEPLVVGEGGTASSTAEGVVHIDQQATYADATFTNVVSTTAQPFTSPLSYASVAGLGMQYDSQVVAGESDTGVYLKHHPYVAGLSSTYMGSSEITLAVVGQMSKENNTMFVHFGNTGSGNPGIVLATGTKTDEVVVKMNVGSTLTEICTMTVPNAATARHVYIITKRDVGDQSTISVYLDGAPWKTVNVAKKTFTGGVQCGSDFGGGIRSIVLPVGDTDTALLNVLRLYNRVISPAEIAKYSSEYPYTSPSGTSRRTFEAATGNWIEPEDTEFWSYKKDATTEAVSTNAPTATSAINLTGTAGTETTISVNLDAATTYESLTVQGAQKITFVKAQGKNGEIDISGSSTISCPMEIQYGALDISGAPLTLVGDGAIEFDLSTLDLKNVLKSTPIPLTGDVTQDDTKVTYKNMPVQPTGRTVAFGYSGTQYVLTVTVDPTIPLVYTVPAEGEGQWSWSGVNCDEPTDWTKVAATEIQKAGAGTATLTPRAFIYNILAGTLKFSAAPSASCQITNVAANAVFDISGQTGYNYAITLNGGSITNSSSESGYFPTLTLVADSFVNCANKIVIQQSGYTATTINLGAHKLTKTGSGEFQLVTTTVNGTGMIDVTEGTLYGSEATTFGADVTLKVGATATIHNRSGKTWTLSKITGEGGTLNNEGTMTAFTLSGTLTLANAGTYGTITMADGAVAKVGNRRNLTFAGAGTVDVQLTAAEEGTTTEITAFNLAAEATTAVGNVYDSTGADVTSHVTRNGNKFTINHEAKAGSTYYITLAKAIGGAAEDSTITMLRDANIGETAIAVNKSLVLAGEANILSGAGFTIASGSTLTISNGYFGCSTTIGEGTLSLVGGYYTAACKTAWNDNVAEGHAFGQLAVTPSAKAAYSWQVLIGSAPTAEQEVLPVVDKNNKSAGSIVLNTSWVAEKTGKASAGEQVGELNTTDTGNGYKKWQNLILGLDGTKATSIPVIQPVQTTEAKQLKFRLSGVNVDTGAGVPVGYRVWTGSTPGGRDGGATEAVLYDVDTAITLPNEGVKYYTLEVSPLTSK